MSTSPFEHGKIEQDGAWMFSDDMDIVAESKDDGFEIHNAVEYMNCRDLEDVGGTEITSDIEYNYGVEWVDSDSILTADAVTKTLTQGLILEDYGVWDA